MQSRLLRATDDWADAPESSSHLHVLRRLFEELKIDALLCVEGRPTVCVKDARRMAPEKIEALRRSLWNLGSTTLLLVEEQASIKVFSTLKRPVKDDPVGKDAQISLETLQSLASAELALHLRQLVRRIETGAIYRDHASLFAKSEAVDQLLLGNLKATRDLLCPSKPKSKSEYHRAHALIGRFLFSCYLFDRKIIDDGYLAKKRLPEAPDMLEFLRSSPSENRAQMLKTLFDALQRDFNGSLFDEALDTGSITSGEADLLLRFLTGEDINTGQLSLFKLYDFSFIPVELISSIYEEFLGTEALIESEKQKSANKQRAEGAYYTPPRLAELTVDIATQGWNTLLDKRCLDPACGSGVFLVILFVRMAEEWRKRNPEADTQDRYDALLRLLGSNIRGVDVNGTACLVSCFSLYLAFLDQMEPRAITELREALDKKGNSKILPRILWPRDTPEPKGMHLATVREANFFTLPADKNYDLIIGNPPWVSRKKSSQASLDIEAWLLRAETSEQTGNPCLNEIPKKERKETFFPAGEFACAFMWKSALHLKPGGKACQILPSRVFIANQTNRFQRVWLQHHRLESVWLLADWRFILFPTADCPCFISRYRPCAEDEALGEFEFITPKVERIDPREALLPVLPDDQKTLWQSDIVDAATKGEAAYAWKKNHWGTPRDARLLERLMQAPRLSSIAKEPPDEPIPDEQRRRYWYKGQGFQPATDSTNNPEPVFWRKTDRFVRARIEDVDLLLLRNDCEAIGNLFQEGLHRSRNPLLYKAPLLLINKGFTKFLHSDFDVLFRHAIQSICAPKSEESELLFLAAYLASPLSQYLLFHATANIGIERDYACLEEILELPFPLPEHTRDPELSQSIVDDCAEILRTLRKQLSDDANLLQRDSLTADAKRKLTEAVYKYFNICQWERELIEDTVDIFRPSSTPSSLNSLKLVTASISKKTHRKEYAQVLARTFRDWTSSTRKHLSTQGLIAERAGLAVVTLIVGDAKHPYAETAADQQVEDLLDRIRSSTSGEANTLFKPLRGFAFYESDRVHILKPLTRRHWTSTAALNDADAILTQMMEENGWG